MIINNWPYLNGMRLKKCNSKLIANLKGNKIFLKLTINKHLKYD